MRLIGATLVAVLTLGSFPTPASTQSARPDPRPWMKPHTPTELEWVAFMMAFRYSDENDSDGVTYSFSPFGDDQTGSVLCRLWYDKNAKVADVEKTERIIRGWEEIQQAHHPWLKVTIEKRQFPESK